MGVVRGPEGASIWRLPERLTLSFLPEDTLRPHNKEAGRMNVNWERLWRSAGIQFVVFFIIAWIVYGDQPKVGASAHKLVSFYDGDRTRILIATVIFGFAVLNLLWFAAAL